MLELPAVLFALEQRPAAVVQRFDIFDGLKAAGEEVFAAAHQASGTAAPERAGAVVGRLISVQVLLGFDDGFEHRDRDGRAGRGSAGQSA